MDYLENKWAENRVIVKKTSALPNKEIKPKANKGYISEIPNTEVKANKGKVQHYQTKKLNQSKLGYISEIPKKVNTVKWTCKCNVAFLLFQA